jgi:hypothetical protein
MLARTIKHEELKGGYSMGKKIIIDAYEISGEFEVMAMYEDGEELESKTVMTEKEWKKHNKEWLEGYVVAATSQKFKRWKRRLNFQKFSGLILLLIALFMTETDAKVYITVLGVALIAYWKPFCK